MDTLVSTNVKTWRENHKKNNYDAKQDERAGSKGKVFQILAGQCPWHGRWFSTLFNTASQSCASSSPKPCTASAEQWRIHKVNTFFITFWWYIICTLSINIYCESTRKNWFKKRNYHFFHIIFWWISPIKFVLLHVCQRWWGPWWTFCLVNILVFCWNEIQYFWGLCHSLPFGTDNWISRKRILAIIRYCCTLKVLWKKPGCMLWTELYIVIHLWS